MDHDGLVYKSCDKMSTESSVCSSMLLHCCVTVYNDNLANQIIIRLVNTDRCAHIVAQHWKSDDRQRKIFSSVILLYVYFRKRIGSIDSRS